MPVGSILGFNFPNFPYVWIWIGYCFDSLIASRSIPVTMVAQERGEAKGGGERVIQLPFIQDGCVLGCPDFPKS